MNKFYLALRFVGGSGIGYYGPVVADGRLTDPVKIVADLAKKQQQRVEESHTLPLAAELVEWAVVSADGDVLAADDGTNGADYSVASLHSWLIDVIGDYGVGNITLCGFRLVHGLRLAWLQAACAPLSPWALAEACCGNSGTHMQYVDPYMAAVSGQVTGISLPSLLQYCGATVTAEEVASWDVVTEAKMAKFLADKLGL